MYPNVSECVKTDPNGSKSVENRREWALTCAEIAIYRNADTPLDEEFLTMAIILIRGGAGMPPLKM